MRVVWGWGPLFSLAYFMRWILILAVMKCTYIHCIYLCPRACLAGPSELHHPNSLTTDLVHWQAPGTACVSGEVTQWAVLTAACGAPWKLESLWPCVQWQGAVLCADWPDTGSSWDHPPHAGRSSYTIHLRVDILYIVGLRIFTAVPDCVRCSRDLLWCGLLTACFWRCRTQFKRRIIILV